MITLRVTDEMIQDWQEHHTLCPLVMALKSAQPQTIADNALPSNGEIIYGSIDGGWYRIYPVPQDTQSVIDFIHAVDHSHHKLPRKRVYHYGEPQQMY